MQEKWKSASEFLKAFAIELAANQQSNDNRSWYLDALSRLEAALEKMASFETFRHVWIHTGDGSHVNATAQIGEWVLGKLIEKKSPDEIVRAFESETNRNVGDYCELSPVFGVQIDNICVLDDGVVIVPELSDGLSVFRLLSPAEFRHLHYGNAILRQSFTVTPAFHKRSPEDHTCSHTSVTHPEFAERNNVRSRVRLACVLASVGPVAFLATVLEPSRSALFVSGEGNLASRPFDARPLTSFPVEAAKVARNYSALASFKEIESLARAIDRLNRSRLAASQVDRALELGIAAEIALMHGKSEGNSEITYKICTRAAWLLGHDSDERKTIFSEVKKLYAARSLAVHTGALSPKKDIDLDAADQLVSRVLSEILYRHAFPNWSELTMGGMGTNP